VLQVFLRPADVLLHHCRRIDAQKACTS
jgi:hypothetical protein